MKPERVHEVGKRLCVVAGWLHCPLLYLECGDGDTVVVPECLLERDLSIWLVAKHTGAGKNAVQLLQDPPDGKAAADSCWLL